MSRWRRRRCRTRTPVSWELSRGGSAGADAPSCCRTLAVPSTRKDARVAGPTDAEVCAGQESASSPGEEARRASVRRTGIRPERADASAVEGAAADAVVREVAAGRAGRSLILTAARARPGARGAGKAGTARCAQRLESALYHDVVQEMGEDAQKSAYEPSSQPSARTHEPPSRTARFLCCAHERKKSGSLASSYSELQAEDVRSCSSGERSGGKGRTSSECRSRRARRRSSRRPGTP